METLDIKPPSFFSEVSVIFKTSKSDGIPDREVYKTSWWETQAHCHWNGIYWSSFCFLLATFENYPSDNIYSQCWLAAFHQYRYFWDWKISKDKAETLNAYFSSMFTVENIQNIPEITSCAVEVLQTIEITPVVVHNKLHDLNPNKSPGHDQRHPYFFKELAVVNFIQQVTKRRCP